MDSNGTDRNLEIIKRLKYSFGTHINTQYLLVDTALHIVQTQIISFVEVVLNLDSKLIKRFILNYLENDLDKFICSIYNLKLINIYRYYFFLKLRMENIDINPIVYTYHIKVLTRIRNLKKIFCFRI